MLDKLQKIREASEIISRDGEGQFRWSMTKAKAKAETSLTLLDEIIATLDSEDLVERVADAICDESMETCNEEYSCLVQGKGQSMMDVAKLLAQAAINTIKGSV